LQQATEHIFGSDPDAPSLGHIGEMLAQHGGRLTLPERPAEEPVQAENGQLVHFSDRAAPRGGLLDDVLGGLAGEMEGEEAPAQHEAGGRVRGRSRALLGMALNPTCTSTCWRVGRLCAPGGGRY
jgi:hypothetical protein